MTTLQTLKSGTSIQIGDIFSLGEHHLACGDATDAKLTARLLNGTKVSQVLSDPPYGVAYVESKDWQKNTSKHRVIVNDQVQSEKKYANFTQKWLEAVKPHLADKNSAYLFNSDKMLFALREGMQNAGWKFAQLLIWVKSNGVVGRLDYNPQHELIVYCWCGTHEFLKSKDRSVLCFPKPAKNVLHPTMKPVSLLRRLILNNTRIGDIVYDPFGGSGSVLIAAEHTKRRCLTIELDPEYCQVTIDRWQKLTGLKTKKLNPLEHD